MPMTKDEVFNKVKEVLTAALAVDDDEVTPEAKLSEDLGAESIDYLDITFQLEKAFGIKIPKGIAELKTRMAFADLSKFEADPDINKFRDIFTVDTLVRYVMTKVNP